MSAPGKLKVMQECGDSRRPNIAVKVGNEQQYVLGSSSETAKTSPSTDNNSIGDGQPHDTFESRFAMAQIHLSGKALAAGEEQETPTRVRCCSDPPQNGLLRDHVVSASDRIAKDAMAETRSQHTTQFGADNNPPKLDAATFDTDSLCKTTGKTKPNKAGG